jgi:three-Cys-motif partner protein
MDPPAIANLPDERDELLREFPISDASAQRSASVRKMNTADSNPEYWGEYSNLQKIKHALIRNYLNGWFPKMVLGPRGCSRLIYIDTHAGRGKHLNGKLGSPLIALTSLLDHQSRDQLLQKTEVRFLFIERDEANVAALNQELKALTLPRSVFAEAQNGDCFEIIENAINAFEKDGKKLAPGFFFVDPYGFKLPGKLLRKLLSYPKVELFVNVIWRELDMAIQQSRKDNKSPLAATLRSVFAGDEWQKIDAADSDARSDQCAALFRNITGALWGTHIRMLDHGRIRYFLLHLTKSDAGRDLMKECIWKACPDGGYYASRADHPDQQLLIEPVPNLKPLQVWVKSRLSAGPKRWQTLTDDLREELWLEKHLNEVVRDMRKDGDIEGDEFTGKFAQANNPLLHIKTNVKQLRLY